MRFLLRATMMMPLGALVVWAALATGCGLDRSRIGDDKQRSSRPAGFLDFCTQGTRIEAPGIGADVLAGPEIQFDATSHDFGIAPAGPSLQHTFVLRNVGDAKLVIDDIWVSCGCTKAVAKETEIPPAGATQIDVDFYTRMFVGPVRETIQVRSNDPRVPIRTLQILATIEHPLDYEPHDIKLITDKTSELMAPCRE